MANKSLYDVYFGAGQSAGQYEAQKQEVGDVWSDIDWSQKLTAQRGARRETNLDTILAGTEMLSQFGQGLEAQKQWKGEFGSVQSKLGEGQRVGRSGKSWEDTGFIEKLFSGKQYKFGGGQVMDKAQIAITGRQLQSGQEVNFDRFKPESAAAEVGLSNKATQSKPSGILSALAPTEELKSRAEGLKQSMGLTEDYYGKRKGFDLGDIIGEKSVPSAILGAGKEKLSSILSRKPKAPEAGQGTVLEVDQKLESKQEELEAIPSPSKDYSKAQTELDVLMGKKEDEGKLSFQEAQNKENEDSILGMMGYYE